MELCDRGTLMDAVSKDIFKPDIKWGYTLAMRALIRSAGEIAKAVSFIHRYMIIGACYRVRLLRTCSISYNICVARCVHIYIPVCVTMHFIYHTVQCIQCMRDGALSASIPSAVSCMQSWRRAWRPKAWERAAQVFAG